LLNHDRARARSAAYSLLSRLFLIGMEEELRPALEAIPEFAALLADRPAASEDSWSADHYAVFGVNIFPFESCFLGSDGLVGGVFANQVEAVYHQHGFDSPQADSPDHIGVQMGYLAWLSECESLAWQAGDSADALRWQEAQKRFLEDHLLRWLITCTQAIREHGHPLYSAAAEMTLALVMDHRAGANDDLLAPPFEFGLPESPLALDDEKTGLWEIAGHLLLPAHSGMFLSREAISQMGRQHGVPRGFGDRRTMLVNLMESAAGYGQLEAVAASLIAIADGFAAAYEAARSAPAPLPAIASVWQARLSATRLILEKLGQAAGLQPQESDV
jgi:hypothetical protein